MLRICVAGFRPVGNLTVLVAGGAGYIGSHAVMALTRAGHEVVVVDNLSTGHRGAVPEGVELVVRDIGDEERVSALLRKRSIDAVMHFAASISVPESVTDPLQYYSNNVEKSSAFIRAVVRAGVPHFVFSSTAAVYGIQKQMPVTEKAPTEPFNPYGRTKLMMEWMLRDIAAATALDYVVLRYFNVAGGSPEHRTGPASSNTSNLVRVACQAALGMRNGIDVYGTDYPTRDGTCIRDFIHVSDIADAHVAALEYLADGGDSQVLNCGYGKGYTVTEILDAVDEVVGTPMRRRIAGRRLGDVAEMVSDASRLRNCLNWLPQHDDVETIVTSALAWEQRLADWSQPAVRQAVGD